MPCTTPGCAGDHGTSQISHQVVYRERTYVIHSVPADVCPDCGDVRLVEETLFHIESLIRRKGRSKATDLVYRL